MQDDVAETPVETISFDQFWPWVQSHPNCILRVANDTMVLFDDDDFHWHFGIESDTVYFVQAIRGKRYVGELVINPSEVSEVRAQANDQNEVLFDILDESSQFLCQFVLSHGFEDEDGSQPAGRLTH
jgi:hypothetical protein